MGLFLDNPAGWGRCRITFLYPHPYNHTPRMNAHDHTTAVRRQCPHQRQTLTVPSRLPASRIPAGCGTVLQMALVIAARYSELPPESKRHLLVSP